MDSIEGTLQQRRIYGSFKEKAVWIQLVKKGIHDSPAAKEGRLSYAELEALENIVQKMGRILYGTEFHADNYIDIAGYATLVVKDD